MKSFAMALLLLPSLSANCNSYESLYVGIKAGVVFASPGCEAQATSCDDTSTGGGFFVGYVVNDWLAFEAGYDYLGEIEASYPAIGHPTASAFYKSEAQGIEFVTKPYWQISEIFSLFAKGGTLLWNVDVAGDEVEFTHHAEDSGWSLLLGAGVEYALNPNWSLLLEYQWMDNVGSDDTGGADYSTFNLGAAYHFGVVTPAVAFTSAPPVNLASQTSSELVAPWSFSGAPFEFNSSILSADLETALQVPLKRLKAHPNAQLHIRAHSDAQGSMQYNQHLSELRAESVRSYFIGEGITAVRVTAEGAGETKPIASNKTAEGRFKNRRVELFSPALNITSTGEQ